MRLVGLPANRSGRATVVAVSGWATGQTALAVHWAHRASNAFPDWPAVPDLHGFNPSTAPAATFAIAVARAPERAA
jgi:hypothetical protein